jgi:hypothetical protein
MNIEINGELFENVPIVRTGDWDVFEENVIPGVTLNQGQNTVRLTQRRSQSSRPDKLEFAALSTLNTNDIEANAAITVFPNPSEGVFNIRSRQTNLQYALRNIQGQLVDSGNVSNNQVDFSQFNTGIYFLELTNNANINTVEKIIIK